MSSYLLTEEQLKEGTNICFDKAKRLLNDAEILLKNWGTIGHAIGLYTFALEEYGKALLLKDCLSSAKEKYAVPIRIFRGRESHKLKIEKALNGLPNNCQIGLRLTVRSLGKSSLLIISSFGSVSFVSFGSRQLLNA